MQIRNFFRLMPVLATLLIPQLSVEAANVFSEPVYVTLRESNQVAKFPAKSVWPGGPKMLYNSITPDGKTLVVSSPKDGGIVIFAAQTGKQIATVKTGKGAKGLKISPNGREAYVSNEAENTISVVDLISKKVVATIKTDVDPHNVRFNQDGTRAYVTLQGGAGLGVVDTTTRKVIKVYPTPGINSPHNLDLSKNGKIAFIRDLTGLVGVLDLTSGKMLKIIKVGNGHAGIDVIPNGKLVATGAIADDYVTLIDTKSLDIVKKIKVGFGPHGVRASRDSRYLYVAITADDKFSVIDLTTLKVTKEYSLKSFPFWVAVNGNP